MLKMQQVSFVKTLFFRDQVQNHGTLQIRKLLDKLLIGCSCRNVRLHRRYDDITRLHVLICLPGMWGPVDIRPQKLPSNTDLSFYDCAMLPFLLFSGLIVATPAPQEDALHKIALPVSRIFTRSTGEVDGPALLMSLQQTLNKYHSRFPISGASASAPLQRRLATENLLDQVGGGNFDEEYYGPMQVGSSSTQQVFTVVFDTGSADIFIPGPQCTSNEGCPYNIKYNERGTSQHRTTAVDYGSGYIEGDDYTDSINVAGLTATNQGIISLTQAAGFNTSASDGLLGMAFTSLAASGFTTFFENLMAQDKVGT